MAGAELEGDRRAQAGKSDLTDRGVVYVETRALNQRGETVLTFRRKVLLYKRGRP